MVIFRRLLHVYCGGRHVEDHGGFYLVRMCSAFLLADRFLNRSRDLKKICEGEYDSLLRQQFGRWLQRETRGDPDVQHVEAAWSIAGQALAYVYDEIACGLKTKGSGTRVFQERRV